MELICNAYRLRFADGGIQVCRDGRVLYFNRRPVFVTVKTVSAINVYYDCPYETVEAGNGGILARGELRVPTGAVFAFADTYRKGEEGFELSRRVTVVEAGDELGFSSKFSLTMAQSASPRDYQCFAPGLWYKQNEYGPEGLIGKDLDCEYFWQLETRSALPLFSMYHPKSGEAAALSRRAADVTLRSMDILRSENYVDPKYTIGALGMSRPDGRSLNYMYYGFAVRTRITAPSDGLSIDYVYPGCDGQAPSRSAYAGLDFRNKAMSMNRVNHPVTPGFTQQYAVCMNFGRYDSFQAMMRSTWRITYDRLRDSLFPVDCRAHFHNCMNIFLRYTRRYGDSFGLPFACQLPDMDVSAVSFQFGFVGQQPGIGYLLMRYGHLEKLPEAFEKGTGILDFWVRTAQTPSGLPQMCYNPNLKDFEPYPYYTRMLADGVEAILNAFVYLHNRGDERPEWLTFCRRTADWLLAVQNTDGSFCRAYHADGSIRMDSRSNTPGVIRFLVQMYLVTRKEAYRQAALRAGEWSFENAYRGLEYRGGTCDNADIQDKEAGIYAMWGFLALYDLTGEDRWLEAAVGAADYTETWTYVWKFPVVTPWPKHPFNRYSISGQSIITVGGGADVYMAACSFTYYRLYLLTGDSHYLDFALFLQKNTKQSGDVDGSIGYCMPALGHESGSFAEQVLQSHYHWLPWCTFVEAEPAANLYDTFGSFEIEEIQKLPPEELAERNRIYAHYFHS